MDVSIPIVIDNGSYQCRVGFACEASPSLVFKNLLAKLRKERGKKDVDIQVGNEIENLDNVRFALKSQFDRNVVIHMEVQETIFDYLFSTLGISSEEKIDHPVVMTEAFLNPNYCRHLMSELLFECYQIPSLAYGVDGLFSLNKNFPSAKDALVVSFGYHTIEVIPYVDGKVDPVSSRRINIGGYELIYFLHRLLQLKYPAHTNTISQGKVEDILHGHGYIAEEFFLELEKWAEIDFYNESVLRLQLPTKPQPSFTQVENLKEKRKEVARKMVEMNARKREEKLAEDEERLVILNEIKEIAKDGGDASELHRALKAAGVATMSELMKSISALKSRIYKAKNKGKSEPCSSTSSNCNEPKPKNLRESESPKDLEKLEVWIAGVRSKRVELLKKRSQRRQKRSDMVKRRTAAAQERMRILSQLAKKEKHDTFGMRDEDWDVYKAIQKDGGGSDSEEEQEELNELEQVLKVHDPSFVTELQLEAKGREEDHELHIGLEKVRAPELIFQPSMIGEPQTGLAETIEHILKLYPSEVQTRLVGNVFLTGGLASFAGMFPRIDKHMLEMRPFQSKYQINLAENPILDAWTGMKDWAADESNQSHYFLSKAEYNEKGGEYLIEHCSSNKYFASPHSSMSALE